ncbi:hypothetical protein PGTUg99_023337 [Puccinia graminis f. sp. tritici]|uniref:Uncharacterized protein n=1 Tax=Puccinia graminis f. sp. tritici TaxID=56615 RepID=A0A5B0Q161_PUCGR|nr:hypothetical protein PGTUg99_023337 [Puccinia graminis f. sp. tritici]
MFCRFRSGNLYAGRSQLRQPPTSIFGRPTLNPFFTSLIGVDSVDPANSGLSATWGCASSPSTSNPALPQYFSHCYPDMSTGSTASNPIDIDSVLDPANPGMSMDNPISIDDELVSRGRPIDRCQTPQLSPRWMRWAEDRMNYFSQSRMATPTPLRYCSARSYREESPVLLASEELQPLSDSASVSVHTGVPRIPPGLVGLHPQFQRPPTPAPVPDPYDSNRIALPEYQPLSPNFRHRSDSPIYVPTPGLRASPSNQAVFDESWTEFPPNWMSAPPAPRPQNLASPVLSDILVPEYADLPVYTTFDNSVPNNEN